MSNAVAFLVVGGALLAPGLLDDAQKKIDPETGLATADPRSILDGHRTAASFYRDTAILGITGTGNATVGLFTLNRFAEVMRALQPTHGQLGSGVFAKLSADECVELIRVTLEACKLGLDTDNSGQGYILSGKEPGASTLGRDLINQVIPGASQIAADQTQAFESLTATSDLSPFGAAIESATALADAISECVKQRAFALQVSSSSTTAADFDPHDAIASVNVLTSEMDQQGITFAPLGIGDLGGAVVTSAKQLPGRVGEVIAGIAGDAIGAIFLSTPVLLLAAGFLVYKAVGK